MPQDVRAGARTHLMSEMLLPPPFTLITLREVGDAFAHATSIAAERGAGTLVYVGRFDLAEFAVVLEPDEPLRTARRTFYAGMVALADAIAAHAPPDVPFEFVWPDAVRVNLGLVGGGRLAWPKDAREDEPPDWMVFSAMIRTVSMADEGGLQPLATALDQEGFTDFSSSALVESFARHLMVATDAWRESGFNAVAREYIRRLPAEKGIRRDIDENGDLLIRRAGKMDVERRKLTPLLSVPSWLDPETRGPKL
jgi:biotin-(acetyl-CoA carboxylase) ligase